MSADFLMVFSSIYLGPPCSISVGAEVFHPQATIANKSESEMCPCVGLFEVEHDYVCMDFW